MKAMLVCLCGWLVLAVSATAWGEDPWVVYEGGDGPGKGKHVVLISGDEEYRSEEALPQLGKILSRTHGFKCTVLFAIDPATGEINPNNGANIPGLEALATADLMVIATRFRNLPPEQMKHIDAYLVAGKPVIGMRTATHAFNIGNKEHPYIHYSNGFGGGGDKPEWAGGFGRAILGEKWVNHHGGHKTEATRGLLVKENASHPILRGIKDGDIFGPTDVYTVNLPLPGDSKPLVLGQVTKRKSSGEPGDPFFGMKPDDEPLEGKKNDPMMPVGWTKSFQVSGGKQGQAFNTTMGSSTDLASAGVRRMLVNAAFVLTGLEVPAEGTKCDVVGEFKPTAYGFGGYTKGLKPSVHALK